MHIKHSAGLPTSEIGCFSVTAMAVVADSHRAFPARNRGSLPRVLLYIITQESNFVKSYLFFLLSPAAIYIFIVDSRVSVRARRIFFGRTCDLR